MNNTVLDQRIAERDQCISAARAMAESEDFNPEDSTFLDLQTRATELDNRVASLTRLLEQQANADVLDAKFAKANQQQRKTQDRQQLQTRESWGEMFIRSAEFTSYRGRGTSAQYELDTEQVQTRALPTGVADLVAAGFKGAPYQADTSAPAAPTPLMNNVTQIQVSGNSLEYIAWSKKAGGATKVAEKAAKPSAEWGPTVTPSTLDNFAVYTQLTRQMIEDFPAVRSLIDNELQRDVARAEEADAAAVLAAASATIPDASNADLLSAIRMGIATVEGAGYTPTAVLLNPADWAALDISVFAATAYGPTVGQSFWGLTPIPSSTQAVGTAVVGDFRSAIHHYYRSSISLYITDSHADTFLSNVFTLLAERRSKTVVVRPQALVEAKKTP
jgi:hypothetical protein